MNALAAIRRDDHPAEDLQQLSGLIEYWLRRRFPGRHFDSQAQYSAADLGLEPLDNSQWHASKASLAGGIMVNVATRTALEEGYFALAALHRAAAQQCRVYSHDYGQHITKARYLDEVGMGYAAENAAALRKQAPKGPEADHA